jgi:hypothetical protein
MRRAQIWLLMLAICSKAGATACRERVASDAGAIKLFPGATMDTEPGNHNVPAKPVVYVTGDVRCPGAFLIANGKGPTLRQALAWAGGPLPTAFLNQSTIIHQTSDGPQGIPIDLENIPKGKMQRFKLGVGDVLVIRSKELLDVPLPSNQNALPR